MSVVARVERELQAAATARPRDSARYAAALERAVQLCDTDPGASELFDLADLYLELSSEYSTLGRYDNALGAADAAIDAGIDMRPDPRCLRAEIFMRAGRVAEAEPIWAAVRADTPTDVWLYNTAGLEYADLDQHEAALDWLTAGLQLALHTRDPERLVGQLADLRLTSLERLGRPADPLQEQAAAFLGEQEQDSCEHDRRDEYASPESTGPVGAVALAWLPAGDYEQAVGLWPELAESDRIRGPDGPVPHRKYCETLQQTLIEYAEAGIPALTIAPVRVAQFTAWCAERDVQPDSAEARAEYAAQLAADADPDLIAWPPGRNQPCWCGSERKYKKCCAARSFADTSTSP